MTTRLPKNHNSPGKVLVVDDDDSIRFLFIHKLEAQGYQALGASSSQEAVQILQRFKISAILLDQFLGDELGTDILSKIFEVSPFTKVVFLTSHDSVKLATHAMTLGANGFLLKTDDIDHNIERFISITEIDKYKTRLIQTEETEIVGKSGAIQDLLAKVMRIHSSDSTVLLTGESGVGKEMFAKAIHQLSDRSSHPFIAVNCAAISENLLEAELFGYKKGAFTDAKADHKGYFETCSSGTLLLDEIGEINPSLQAKLLRVIQEKEVTPVGSVHPLKVNTRVIAATNRNLQEEVQNHNFREDLYYRLAVINLEIPPLRDRAEDIPILTEHFLKHFNKRFKKSIKAPTNEVYSRLKAYSWPGNIRELYNAVERAVLLADEDRMEVEDLLPHRQIVESKQPDNPFGQQLPNDYSKAKDTFEKAYIENLLKITNYNISDAAKISNQYRTNIYRLIKKHNINIERGGESKSS